MIRTAVAAAALLGLAATANLAAADAVSGAFRCNETDLPVRAAVAAWDPGTRELRVMLFKAPPVADAVKFWIAGGRGGYPPEWEYAAKFTFTFKDAAVQATQASLRDFHIYVDCPTLQANLTGGAITPRGAEKLRRWFPAFEATLSPGGRVRLTATGADKLELPTPTAVSWDVSVDAPVAVK